MPQFAKAVFKLGHYPVDNQRAAPQRERFCLESDAGGIIAMRRPSWEQKETKRGLKGGLSGKRQGLVVTALRFPGGNQLATGSR